jgi:hypothetical protein
VSHDRQNKWNATIILWNEVMSFAHRREDFDKEAIKQFQTHAEDWFTKWIGSSEGMV